MAMWSKIENLQITVGMQEHSHQVKFLRKQHSSIRSETGRIDMDAFSTKVKTFDAFPKLNSQHAVRSQRGGLSTIMTIVFILFVTWVQIGGFIGGYVDHQFVVDDQIRSDLRINLDMKVAMPCEFLHTNVMDITDDRFLASEVLNFQGSYFFVPEMFRVNDENNDYETPELEEIMLEAGRYEFDREGYHEAESAPACHIFGSIPVNQVSGDFHITAKGMGYRDRAHVDPQALNFSHVIAEFSFGDFYPLINNPLDFTGKTTNDHFQAYKYYAKVVPTLYERMGLQVDTNQYSITELHRTYELNTNGRIQGVPGIFFKYEFEAIKLIVSDKRIPFTLFVARLATIIGGVFIVAGYLFRVYEKLLKIFFGKKYVTKDTERKEGGLLDRDVHDRDF